MISIHSLLKTIKVFRKGVMSWTMAEPISDSIIMTIFFDGKIEFNETGSYFEIYNKIIIFLWKSIEEYMCKNFSCKEVKCGAGNYNGIFYRDNCINIELVMNEENLKEIETLVSFDLAVFERKEIIDNFKVWDYNIWFCDNDYRIPEYIQEHSPYVIGKNGMVITKFMMFYIFFKPQGTIFKNPELSHIEIGNDCIVEVKKSDAKNSDVKKIKYGFVRRKTYEKYIEDKVKSLLETYKVDRIFNQYSEIYWIDADCGLIIRESKNKRIFDEISQKDIQFLNSGIISYYDPQVRISICPPNICQNNWLNDNNIDYHSASQLPNGEYTDCLTNKKFQIRDAKVVEEKKKKFWFYTDITSSPLCTKNLLDNKKETHPNDEHYLVCLKGGLKYHINNNHVVSTSIASPFEFVDEFSGRIITL